MKILSIDTSSNICGVSILENNELICNLDTNTGRTHSENLMPMINRALINNNIKLKDINLLVCNIGPGSFTGIRIGVSTVKAFNDSLDIPYIGISSLESLVYNIKNNIEETSVICSILDCKNDNCYFALYEKKGNTIQNLIEPQAENINSCISILKSYYDDSLNNPTIYFIGDGSETFKKLITEVFQSAKFADSNLNILNSYSLGIAGLEKYNSNIFQEELLPLYLKKPQAQRQLEEKEKNHNINTNTF